MFVQIKKIEKFMSDNLNKKEHLILKETIVLNRPILLNRADAAHYLGLSANTLALWAHFKKYDLPMVKLGGAVRYRVQDLDKFIEDRILTNEKITKI